MTTRNNSVAKIAGAVLGGIVLLWVGWVSSAIVRAEVRESRLCAVEAIIVKMQTSIDDLADIRDAIKLQTEAMQNVIKQLEEKTKGGHLK